MNYSKLIVFFKFIFTEGFQRIAEGCAMTTIMLRILPMFNPIEKTMRSSIKELAYALLGTLFVLCCANSSAYAEADCSSVISYTVARESENLTEVFYGELRAKGADEISTKAKIETDILKNKAKALERCKNQYENTAGCVQGKLSASAGVFQSSTFSARKALEDALLADCKKQQGTCREVKSSEIKCTVIEPTPTAGAAGKDGKKDEKAKK